MLIPLARQLLRVLPDPAAYAVTRTLASRTHRPPISHEERAALATATRLTYGNGKNAWSWGKGTPVVLVHGWNGRAAQLAPLAAHIAASGFRAVAPDITGHGDSSGNRTEWACFLRDIRAITQALKEPPYAFIGHSAGALTTMALRHEKRIHAERYVLIAAPTYPFPAIHMIRRKLAPRHAVIERYQNHVAGQFGMPWEALRSGCVFKGIGSETLLIYDTTDRFVDHGEGDHVAENAHEARLIKTSGYSHMTILGAPEVRAAVGDFLADRACPCVRN